MRIRFLIPMLSALALTAAAAVSLARGAERVDSPPVAVAFPLAP
jgi:hypothetical protein